MRRLIWTLLLVGLLILTPSAARPDCTGSAAGSKGSAGCASTGDKDRGGTSPGTSPVVTGRPKIDPKPCLSGGRPIPCALPFTTPNPADPTPTIDVRALAQTAALQLEVPPPNPMIGPDPTRNKWNMIPIGFPIWIFSEQPRTLTASTTQQGITITMVANADATTVSFGDGTTITCRTMTRRAPILDPPDQHSPDCGHVYQDKNSYTITATTTWNVEWQAMGQHGTLTLTNSASTTLRVGELTAVLVPER